MRGVSERLRAAGVLAAVVTLGVALLSGAAYGALSLELGRLNGRKATLTANISGKSQIEATLIAIQARAVVVEKVRAKTVSWDNALTIAEDIAQSGTVTNAGITEDGHFKLTLVHTSLSGALSAVRRVRALVSEGAISGAVLESFHFADDGTIQLSVSFGIPI